MPHGVKDTYRVNYRISILPGPKMLIIVAVLLLLLFLKGKAPDKHERVSEQQTIAAPGSVGKASVEQDK